MTTRSHHPRATRHIDLAGLALVVCGLLSGIIAYVCVTRLGQDPLLLVPSVVAMTIGALHLTRWVAPRE